MKVLKYKTNGEYESLYKVHSPLGEEEEKLMVKITVEYDNSTTEYILPLNRDEYSLDSEGNDVAKEWYDLLPLTYPVMGEDEENVNLGLYSYNKVPLSEFTGQSIPVSEQIGGFFLSDHDNGKTMYVLDADVSHTTSFREFKLVNILLITSLEEVMKFRRLNSGSNVTFSKA